MKMEKMMSRKVLATGFALALGCSAMNANATVDMNSATANPAKFAKEIKVEAAGTDLTNDSAVIDATVDFGFAASASDDRYVRFDLSNGAKFKGNPTLAITDDVTGSTTAGATGTVADGGDGKSFVIFTVSNTGGIENVDDVTLASVKITVVNQGAVDISYSQYETAGEAQNKSNALKDKTASYISWATGLITKVYDASEAKIDVTAESKKFESSALTTNIAKIDIGYDTAVHLADGTAIGAMSDLVASGTKLIISGDYTAVEKTTTGYDNSKVFGSTVGPFTKVEADKATYDIDTASLTTETVSMTVEGKEVIQEATYTGLYDVVPATGMTTSDVDLGTLAVLKSNGATDTINFMLTPGGTYQGYMRISNTSGMKGKVFLTVYNDAGKSVALNLDDISGQPAELDANASTSLISVADLYAAAQAKDSTFDASASKLRVSVKAEVPDGKLSAQAFTLSTDGTTFSMTK